MGLYGEGRGWFAEGSDICEGLADFGPRLVKLSTGDGGEFVEHLDAEATTFGQQLGSDGLAWIVGDHSVDQDIGIEEGLLRWFGEQGEIHLSDLRS